MAAHRNFPVSSMRLVARRAMCGDPCPSCMGPCAFAGGHSDRPSDPHCCSVCGARWRNYGEGKAEQSGPEAA